MKRSQLDIETDLDQLREYGRQSAAAHAAVAARRGALRRDLRQALGISRRRRFGLAAAAFLCFAAAPLLARVLA